MVRKSLDPEVADKIRSAILADERSPHAIAIAAGLAGPVVSRFMRGERELRMSSLARLMETLGLHIVDHDEFLKIQLGK